jgi:hypothetical protein
MRQSLPVTGDQLTSALHVLGVNFLLGGKATDESLHKQPTRLIAALAESSEARVRLSLIPLFLEHPEFSTNVRQAAEHLGKTARITLQCYYSAAVFLQQKHRANLEILIGEKTSLPDHFSRDLGLEMTDDPEESLQSLAQRHQALSGAQVNWLGTYQHAAQIWIRGLELQGS